MTRYLLYLLIFIFSAVNVNAQLISLDSQTALPCQTVDFPIFADELPTDVAAVTLYIEMDSTVISYSGSTPGTLMGYNINYFDNIVGISWSNPGGQDLNGTMLTLHFKYLGGACALEFADNCELATASNPLETLTVFYTDGSIAPKPLVHYYVDGAVGSSGDGLSWATALKKISEATNKPLEQGSRVYIKPGFYSDTMVVKKSGAEIVPLTFGVTVSDTNKITFPDSTSLACIDLVNYPGSYYAYVYRSWKGNNGVYKITGVNKTDWYVIVDEASFLSETGATADSSLLQASIGMPVVFEKYASNPEAQRIILNPAGLGGRAALHIGKIISTGEFDVDPANYNIVDGIDVTGAANSYGVRIQNSRFNVYKNSRIYELDSIGFLISGNTAKPANHNFILNNSFYNTTAKAIKIGIQDQGSPNNQANLNHVKHNDIFSSGTTGTKINYVNAVEICRFTGYTVLENNTLRNFKMKNINRGAIHIRNNVRKVLVYSNYIKNIDRVNTGTHAAFYLQNQGDSNNVFNNVIVDSAALNNDVFAFWVNVNGGYTGGKIAYNTVHYVDNGFKLESGSTNVDFEIKNNIMSLGPTSPINFSISGTGLFNVSHNCYTSEPVGQYPGEPGRLVGNPSFLQPDFFLSPYGFSLIPESICLGSGDPLSTITSDFREMGRDTISPSRGAFEEEISNIYWTGKVSTNWHNHLNWSPEFVPTSTIQAIIPLRSNLPAITDSNAACKGLQLQQGASVQVDNHQILRIY